MHQILAHPGMRIVTIQLSILEFIEHTQSKEKIKYLILLNENTRFYINFGTNGKFMSELTNSLSEHTDFILALYVYHEKAAGIINKYE